ncbi:MAG: glycosyltransferase [Actinobacteria bacterium]|nr:MAG: glycosyltransferase [Actinomycetota bacterium]
MARRDSSVADGTRSILIVTQPTSGGVIQHVLYLADGLAESGWNVTVAGPKKGRLASGIDSERVNYVELPMVRRINPISDLPAFVKLLWLCGRLKPDVLHLHSSKAGFLGRVAGRLARVPVVVFSPKCWSFQSATGLKHRLYVSLEGFASRFCDKTIAVSQREIDDALRERVLGPDDIVLINNGITPSPGNPLPPHVQAIVDSSDEIIVSAGRLDEQKGYAYLVDAMAEVMARRPSTTLVVAGEGPYESDLNEKARALGISESVNFVGEIQDVRPLLEQSTLFILSSLWEGLPHAIIEAMAAGLPTVATDVGGSAELIEENRTGVVVPAKDAQALATAILSLLEDPARMSEMGRLAREKAERDYALEKCISSNASLYLALLDKREGRAAGHEISRRRRLLSILLIAAGVLSSMLALADELVFADRVFPGVRVGPVDIGFRTRAEASRELTRLLARRRPILLVTPDGSHKAKVNGSSLGVDTARVIEAAYLKGRTGALPRRVAERLVALTRGTEVGVGGKPAAGTKSLLRQVGGSVYRPAADASFVYRRGQVSLLGSKPGRKLNYGQTIHSLTYAFLRGSTTVTVTVDPLHPLVTTEEASVALLDRVVPWTTRDAVLRFGKQRVALKPPQLLSVVSLRGGIAVIDASKLSPHLASLRRAAYRSPVNSYFRVSGNRPYQTQSRPGVMLDTQATAQRLQARLDAGSHDAVVAVKAIAPARTRAELEALGIKQLLSSFTTRFHPGKDGRDVNIALASRAFRGTVLGPGEVFSLNKATGPRNRSTGYRESLGFLGGRIVPAVGGGTCQVSSTLYQAALRANLKVLERSNHSMAVSYVPPGLDATTFYPSIDLKFQNTRSSPIMLWSAVRGNRLTVQVYGSGKRPSVRIATVIRKTTPPKYRHRYDDRLPPGTRVVDSAGYPGYVVRSYRIITEGGRSLKRELLATDNYRPKNWVVLIGR